MTLIDQYREMHRTPKMFGGYSVLQYAYIIRRMIGRYGCRTLLDYGCGKGEQYARDRVHEWWGVMPTLYDPAVPGKDTPPVGRFGGVICVDVLEHLEEPEIPGTLDRLFGHAEHWVFLAVCPRLSSRLLPDGRNCHLTVRPGEWWEARVQEARGRCPRRVKWRLEITP